MKILITGSNGMLAKAIIEKFSDGNELVLTDVNELDITNLEKVNEKVLEVKPDLVINCAAYTKVDDAEDNLELVRKINAIGPKNLAIATKNANCTLVHISTDYVFEGNKSTEFAYSEDEQKNPITAYGITKSEGEDFVFENNEKSYVFRTAWLYGDGNNFVRTMLKLASNHPKINVVSDQHGSPTYTEDLTNIIYDSVTKKIPYGIYHSTNMGYTTWDEFAREIFKLTNTDVEVVSVTSDEFPTKAKRPLNSMLSKEKLLLNGIEVPYWKEGLKKYLKKEGKLNG